MNADEEPTLDGLWYFAAFTRELSMRPLRRLLFGEPFVIGVSMDGAVFLLPDVCPHRAAPLSKGRVTGEEIECPYHGWRFDLSDGRCVSAPALCADSGVDVGRVRLRAPRIAVRQGVVWIYRGDGEPESEPPAIAISPDHAPPKVRVLLQSEGPFDEAVIGLVDPAHTPVVHRQWWWRQGAARRDKAKRFEPSPIGFVMPAHTPSGNSRIYKLLGGTMTTTIEFRLPAIRIETIENASRCIVSLTAMTPAEKGKTHIAHMIWWTPGLLDLARPFAQSMAEDFLGQDRDILVAQNENLALAPHRPLFLGDPDEPAKWYLQLKKSWRARHETGGFRHPLKAAHLRWRT